MSEGGSAGDEGTRELGELLGQTGRAHDLLREAQAIAGLGNTEFYVPDTGVAYWSPQVYEILGIDPHEPPGHARIFAGLHPDDRDRCLAAWAAALREPGTFNLAYRFIRPDGDVRHIEARYQLTRLDNGRMRAIGTVHDVTERKLAEEAVRDAHERLERVSRLAGIGELTAGISHELNQPLAAIANYAQAGARLLAAPTPDLVEVRGALEQIAAQALRAGEIMRRFRGFARQDEQHREPADLGALVTEVQPLLEMDASSHGARLRLELSPGLPPALVDGVQIQQVIVNLTHNALEAAADANPGGGEVVIETRRTADGDIEVAVSDNGAGLSADTEQRIFEPFYTTKRQGTGLGLAISRTIAETHGATLGFRRLERGSCFHLTLTPMETA